jgi:hypothetical protein
VTAAVPDPRFRDQLAEALPESLGPVGLRRRAIPALGVEAELTGYGLTLLDALLPVVRYLAAEELRELAGSLESRARLYPHDAAALDDAALKARDRADALDATPDHGKA